MFEWLGTSWGYIKNGERIGVQLEEWKKEKKVQSMELGSISICVGGLRERNGRLIKGQS